MFALWGLSQLIMGLMYVFILIEYVMRIVIGKALKPLGELYCSRTVPGAVGNLILIPLAFLMILWALVSRKKGRK